MCPLFRFPSHPIASRSNKVIEWRREDVEKENSRDSQWGVRDRPMPILLQRRGMSCHGRRSWSLINKLFGWPLLDVRQINDLPIKSVEWWSTVVIRRFVCLFAVFHVEHFTIAVREFATSCRKVIGNGQIVSAMVTKRIKFGSSGHKSEMGNFDVRNWVTTYQHC